MRFSSRLLTSTQRDDLVTLEARRRDMPVEALQKKIQRDGAAELPDGRRLVCDGRWYELTPTGGR